MVANYEYIVQYIFCLHTRALTPEAHYQEPRWQSCSCICSGASGGQVEVVGQEVQNQDPAASHLSLVSSPVYSVQLEVKKITKRLSGKAPTVYFIVYEYVVTIT